MTDPLQPTHHEGGLDAMPESSSEVKLESGFRFVRQNWAIMVVLSSIAIGYVSMSFVLKNAASQVEVMQKQVDEMRLFGHPQHEQRITRLEQDKGDRAAMTELTRSLDKLADAVRSDHDIVVRLVTLAEQQSKQQRP